MAKCPRCQHNMTDDTLLVCEKCGYNLEESPAEQTTIQRSDIGPLNAIISGWGKSTYQKRNRVFIHIQNAGEPITICPEDEFRFGRYHKDGPSPDLDLSPYGAQEKGVSRIHAALQCEGNSLQIVDLDSTNGTYLNEEQLTPNQPHILRSGDMIRLGQLVFYVYFE